MNGKYRILAALSLFLGLVYALDKGVSGPMSLLFGVAEDVVEQWVLAALCLALSLWLARIAKLEFFHGYLERSLGVKVPALIGDVGAVTVLFAGICLILAFVFGQDISALVVTGAGSLAILGFALKDFAVALVAGVSLNFDNAFKVGNRVRLLSLSGGSPVEGVVQRITWRNTVLLTDAMQQISIPNFKIMELTVVGCDVPDARVKRSLQLEINYDVSMDSVERILIAGVLGAVGVKLAEPPTVQARSLNRTGITYAVDYVITDHRDGGSADHAVIKSILNCMRVANVSVASGVQTAEGVRIANRALDVYHLVQQVRLFSGWPAHILQEIASLLQPRHYAQGAAIVFSGGRDDSLFIVAEGMACRAEVDQEGRLGHRNFIATEFFGDQALFGNLPHQATVTAQTSVLLYRLSRDALRRLLEKYPELVDAFAERLAQLNAGGRAGHGDALDQPLENAQGALHMKDVYKGVIEANYPVAENA